MMEDKPVFLPIAFCLARPAVVVGGGDAGQQRAEALLQAGAKEVRVVEPENYPWLGQTPKILWVRAPYQKNQLLGASLVFAATLDPALNARVAEDARALRIPVNAMDALELCDFHMPAVLWRKKVSVAVSTGGSSPFLARLLRQMLDAVLPEKLGDMAERLESLRLRLKASFPDPRRRLEILERTFLRAFIAEKSLDEEPGASLSESKIFGQVLFVGAGPGGVEHMTLQALIALALADVVVHDRLVPKETLSHAKKGALVLEMPCPQAQEARQGMFSRIVCLAQEGKTVLRLKGGDPLIFSRAEEEMRVLLQAGVFFTVVPGISAAQAAAAILKVPLTHRRLAHALVLTSARLADGSLPDFASLWATGGTLAFYMAGERVGEVARGLIDAGASAHTAAALVVNAGRPATSISRGDLAFFSSGFTPAPGPALFLAGEALAMIQFPFSGAP